MRHPSGSYHSRRGGPRRDHMRVRRKLFNLVRDIARCDELGDEALAHCIHTSRPRASALLHGHIEKFNTETLIDILARLGVEIDINIVRRRGYLRWNIRNPRPGWRPPPGVARD